MRNSRRISDSRRKRRKQLVRRGVILIGIVCLGIGGFTLVREKIASSGERGAITAQKMEEEEWVGAPSLDVQLLDVNEYSRPGTPLKEIKGIVIHYTANPGTTAKNNRDYFQGLKDSHETKVRKSHK